MLMGIDFYDETKNFLFVKKGKDGSLIDRIFIYKFKRRTSMETFKSIRCSSIHLENVF